MAISPSAQGVESLSLDRAASFLSLGHGFSTSLLLNVGFGARCATESGRRRSLDHILVSTSKLSVQWHAIA